VQDEELVPLKTFWIPVLQSDTYRDPNAEPFYINLRPPERNIEMDFVPKHLKRIQEDDMAR